MASDAGARRIEDRSHSYDDADADDDDGIDDG